MANLLTLADWGLTEPSEFGEEARELRSPLLEVYCPVGGKSWKLGPTPPQG